VTGGGVVKIVVADDHRLLREALCHILSAEPDFEVVGEADSGRSAVRIAAESRPDVLLLDIEMPGEDIRATVYELLAGRPALGIIALSVHSEPRLLQQLLDLGVRAYLHKNVSQGMLKSTIRDLAGARQRTVTISLPTNGSVTAPQVSRPPAVASARPVSRVDVPVDAPAGCPLSERELQVLTFVADALTNRQIASRLDITEGTVKRHMRNIFSKLGATSRIDALNKAVDALLIPPSRARRAL
jgi:DNA-binding NarL/FixJ family response regulator